MSSVMPSQALGRWMPLPHWRRPLLLLGLVLAVLLLLYRDTALAMVSIWYRSETFAHAFVVPPIALWLMWRRRADLAPLRARPAYAWLLPLALAALGWLLGELAAVNALTQLCLVAMLVISVPLLLGNAIAWQLAFPLAFLFFCVPIGEFLMPQLMESTADFTVAALRLSGIPVFREGQQFVIPSGNWSVVEACSGLRYLVASVMVGTLFAYLNYRSLRRRLVFIAFAIVLPLVANWVRAYLIVMIGHLSSNRLATGADHLVYGWVFFGLVMLMMFLIGARWAESQEAAPATPAAAAVRIAPTPWLAAGLALLVLLVPPLAVQSFEHEAAGRASVALSAPTLANWPAGPTPLEGWRPSFQHPAAELQTGYLGAAREQVGLYLAYYRHQGYDSKVISSQNELVTTKDKLWAQVGEGADRVVLAGHEFGVRSAELRSSLASGLPESRALVWRFYWINGRLTARDAEAKAYGAVYRLLGRGDDAAAIVLYAPIEANQRGAAEQVLRRFLTDNWAAIEAALMQARSAGH